MKLFLSYSRDDNAWTNLLWRSLRDEAHHDAWIDRRIIPATDWWESILSEIEKCKCFIYILSPHSVQSIYCKAELKYALALNKPILPLLLKPCEYPKELNQKHVQYQEITDDMSLDKVLLKIEQALRQIDKGYAQGKYEKRDTVRPPLPKPGQKPEDVYETLILAKVAIALGEDEVALEFYGQVLEVNPDGLRLAEKERIESIRETAYTNVKMRTGSHANNIPAPPFQWIEIAGGEVNIEKGGYVTAKLGKKYSVALFYIAKYPITNTQFAQFIDAGGYSQQNYWTEAGFQEKEKHDWVQPRFWQEQEWKGSEQPVVGVSWYEAYAFTQWLGEETNEPVSLPTEQQWQRAAQGDDERIYPWGNVWNCDRCNNRVEPCNSDQTTIVTQYEGIEKGDSLFGVVDMAGNVLEWCLTTWERGSNDAEETGNRMVRGGSWFHDNKGSFHVTTRLRVHPSNWYNDWGFRVSRSYT